MKNTGYTRWVRLWAHKFENSEEYGVGQYYYSNNNEPTIKNYKKALLEDVKFDIEPNKDILTAVYSFRMSKKWNLERLKKFVSTEYCYEEIIWFMMMVYDDILKILGKKKFRELCKYIDDMNKEDEIVIKLYRFAGHEDMPIIDKVFKTREAISFIKNSKAYYAITQSLENHEKNKDELDLGMEDWYYTYDWTYPVDEFPELESHVEAIYN